MKLWQEVQTNCKKSFRARRDEKNKLINNVANYGLKIDDVCVRMRDGEYTDFGIKALENMRPLLTDYRISKAIKFLDENNIESATRVLYLDNEVKSYGVNVIYSVIKEWLVKNDIDVPSEYINNAFELDEDTMQYVLTTRSDSLRGKVQINNIGKSKQGQSVVPEDWLGKEFSNGRELHKEMDNLDWRKGKPPVCYCCTYTMIIQEKYSWKNKTDEVIMTYNPSFSINIGNKCSVIHFTDNYNEWLNNLDDSIDILPCVSINNKKYIIACQLKNIIGENKYNDTENVGFLVSKLQKAIRRGRKCSKILYETMNDLGHAKPYNLPEQQYVKVSGTRQLCWRLFITIVEDVEAYLEDDNYYSLLDLLCYALLAQNDPEIQFNENIINKMAYTALLVQYNDNIGRNWDWRKGNLENNCDHDFLNIAMECMPMMSGDMRLLKKSGDLMNGFEMKKMEIKSLDDMLGFCDEEYSKECVYASNDMHCNPNILLYLQSSLDFVPCEEQHTTYKLAQFIWENSSKYNVRNVFDIPENRILKSLKDIQKNDDFTINEKVIDLVSSKTDVVCQNDNLEIPLSDSRLGFLLLFGKKVHLSSNGKQKSMEIIIAGTHRNPCKVKQGDKYLADDKEGVKRYVEYMNQNNIVIDLPNPPEGYKWNIKNKKVKLNAKCIGRKMIFYVNDEEILPFDSRKLLVRNNKVIDDDIPTLLKPIVSHVLYQEKTEYNEWQLNLLLRKLWKIRHDNGNCNVFQWSHMSHLDSKIWKCVLAKLYNNYNDEIQIGPIDRKGHKLHESIHYLYEGVIWRLCNLLAFLYPNAMRPKTMLKFIINKHDPTYLNLISTLESLALDNNKQIITVLPIIKTKLWEHQLKSSNEIFLGMTKYNKKGYGDASNVGSGKTLSTLNVMAKLLNYNYRKNITNYSGFLVLLPTTKLYDTWKDEIRKHTMGFNIVEQSANGQLSGNITWNTIVITTLGRMRDHPVYNSWICCIIDECLSVQNKDAFQTEEAWRQVLNSQYGVMMMSATFFRSRFDKLFYMIKMLRAGLPESKEYLDTLLSETIVCNVTENKRVWNTNINKFKLDDGLRKQYDEILMQDISSEQLYVKLNKLIYDCFDYIGCFKNIIEKIGNRKALIYAKSKDEADKICLIIENVTRYPDKTGQHVVLSYAEGTYGLNDLVIYNTIITRPPESDKLPQMKGRLDRPNQKSNNLYIEYILTENTIEEAGLLRLELCNTFYKNHIMPLADFYDLAVGMKKINKYINIDNMEKGIILIDDDDSAIYSESIDHYDCIDFRGSYIKSMEKTMNATKLTNISCYLDHLFEIEKMREDIKNLIYIL